MTQRAPVLDARFEFVLSEKPALVAVEGHVNELFGFETADFLSSQVNLLDRLHANDTGFAAKLFESDGVDSGAINLRVRHAGGHIRCVRANFQRQKRDGASLLNVVLQDAKSLWAASDGQAQSPQFRAMIEHAADDLFFKDLNHVFTAATRNFKAALLAAWGVPELVGLTDYDFVAEPDADNFYRLEQEVLDEGVEKQEIHEVSRQDGDTAWIHIRAYPVRSEAGEIIGLFAHVREITQAIRAEERLDETEESLRESQRIAGVGSYLLNLQRGVLATSSLADSIFGVDRSYPHTFEAWRALIHPDDLDHVTGDLDRYFVEGKPFDKEYRIIRKNDQAVRWIHGLGRVEVDDHDRPLVIRGTVQDVTDGKQIEAELREAKDRLQLFIKHAPAALAVFDRDMRYLIASRRWIETFHLTGSDIIGRCPYDMFPDMPERWKEAHRRGLAGESVRCDEDRYEGPGRSVQWTRWEVLPWRASDGSVGGILVFVEDVTRFKEAEQRLQLAAGVFQQASEGILVTDLDGNILDVNDSFSRMTGYSRGEAIGRNPRILKSGLQDQRFYQEMWREIKTTGRWQGELWNRAKSGTLFAIKSTITTVHDAAGQPQYYLAMFFDITPIKEQERKLAQIARYDALTGLPNRELFTERLRNAMNAARQSGQRLAVAYFDLDAFKKINDIHGHEAADALLVSVASHMKEALREGDTLARIGGDEYVVLMRDVSVPSIAAPALARLLEAASQPFHFGDHVLEVTATAGASFYPQIEEVDADQLMRQADRAMYEAKLAGKNRFHVFDPWRDHSVRGRHEETDQIRRALAENELMLYYQPVVNMATGELMGAEALIRWQHPQRGLLPPSLFLPAIEDHDLMIEVGEWVISSALKQIAAWEAAGLHTRISVNVSARQLEQPEFIDRLHSLLAMHPTVRPSSLELEVLETSALEDVARVSTVVAACRQLGMSVAIDDFGTGYSSLTYLKRLPVSILKIDQSFVRDMLEDPDDLTILQGVIGLAGAFRRMAIAEGVESVEHGVLLLKLGCLYAQGYGIARPMPASELPAWFANWRPDPRWTSVRPMSPINWPLLVAEVEIRSWTMAFEAFMRGERILAPEMDEAHCRFGAWLNAEKHGARGALPALYTLRALHAQSHGLAKHAADSRLAGHDQEAECFLAQLLDVRTRMLDTLKLMSSWN